MADANITLRKSDYSVCGIATRDDVRHEILRRPAAALVAACLIGAHQIPRRPGTDKTLAGYLPNGTRVKQGSISAQRVPGSKRIFKAGKNFVMKRRFDDAEVSRREVCCLIVWRKRYCGQSGGGGSAGNAHEHKAALLRMSAACLANEV